MLRLTLARRIAFTLLCSNSDDIILSCLFHSSNFKVSSNQYSNECLLKIQNTKCSRHIYSYFIECLRIVFCPYINTEILNIYGKHFKLWFTNFAKTNAKTSGMFSNKVLREFNEFSLRRSRNGNHSMLLVWQMNASNFI